MVKLQKNCKSESKKFFLDKGYLFCQKNGKNKKNQQLTLLNMEENYKIEVIDYRRIIYSASSSLRTKNIRRIEGLIWLKK